MAANKEEVMKKCVGAAPDDGLKLTSFWKITNVPVGFVNEDLKATLYSKWNIRVHKIGIGPNRLRTGYVGSDGPPPEEIMELETGEVLGFLIWPDGEKEMLGKEAKGSGKGSGSGRSGGSSSRSSSSSSAETWSWPPALPGTADLEKKKEAARAEEEAEEEVLAAASFARGVELMTTEGDASPRWSEASIGSAASAGVVLTARGARRMV